MSNTANTLFFITKSTAIA